MRWKAILACLMGLTLLAANGAASAQQKIRMQTAVPSASIYFELLQRYAERVKAMSNGRLEIEVLPDGAIVPAFEILDAVDNNVVEAGYAWTHYWSGKHPAATQAAVLLATHCFMQRLLTRPGSPGKIREFGLVKHDGLCMHTC